jgi:hypothetical protein
VVEGVHSSGRRIRLTLTLSEVQSGDELMFIAMFEQPNVCLVVVMMMVEVVVEVEIESFEANHNRV